jgi:hypothetical protein
MPKNSKLTIIPGGGSKKPSNEQTCEGNIDVIKKFQDQFFILIANIPTFLRFPYILDLVSIMGESNINASTQFLKDSFAIRPALLKELSASLLETFQVILKLITVISHSILFIHRPQIDCKSTIDYDPNAPSESERIQRIKQEK